MLSPGAMLARSRRPPVWLGASFALLLIVLMAVIRLGLAGKFPLPIGYGVPVVVLALFRSRRLLWFTTLAFAVLSIIKFFVILPEVPRSVHLSTAQYDRIEGVMVVLDLLLVAALVDIWIVTSNWLDKRNIELEASNEDLAAREEEIARQNEELQSQTEELERQSEELRVANEELGHRERTLEILLGLSRSLGTEMSRDDIMTRICETLGLLINGPTTATAILEREGNQVIVRCHHGFGPAGLERETIPLDVSFAGIILGKARTGYIEDMTLRPDLSLPQPRAGPPINSVLATPLRVRGIPVGSLEVYSGEKRSWSQEQISLVESLAAQTSVSLEAAQLFESVMRERNRFEAVLRTVPIGIAVCNSDCSEVRLNPAGAALMNVPADYNLGPDLIQGNVQAFREGQALGPDEYPITRAARGEEVHAEEIELMGGGRRSVVLAHARPIRDPEGRIQGAVSTFADITTQKELQRELDTRRREAEEASVRKTRFLAAVSHDIRTPANAISLLAELIRRTATNPALIADVPELAQELHNSAVSLVNLLSDVLDVARFDSDRVELQENEFSLSTLLADEQRQMLPLARQKGLSLEVILPADPIVLRTDRIKLGRIVGNLIGNAIKFTEHGGVKVGAHRNGDGTVVVSVSDTGVGIAPEHLTHIFDEFFQLRNPERDRTKGSGLGLTICKRLVDAMGGKLDVHSQPTAGSTFTVTLPPFAVVPQ